MPDPYFDRVSHTALAHARTLVPWLLPGGKFEGHEYVVRNPNRADSHPGSFKINTVTGCWADFAMSNVCGRTLVGLTAYIRGITIAEALKVLAEHLKVPGHG
jgi:hypothetical protein